MYILHCIHRNLCTLSTEYISGSATKTGNVGENWETLSIEQKKNNSAAQEIAIHGDKLNVGDSWAKAKEKAEKI